MNIHKQVTEALPRKDIKAVIPIFMNSHESYDKSMHWAVFLFSNNLSPTVKRDVAVLRDICKLPCGATTGLNLDRDMPAGFIRCDDVVVWNIAREGGCD